MKLPHVETVAARRGARPLRMMSLGAAASAFGVADPAQNYTLEQWQLLIDTHDGLVSFQKAGGAAGNKIVPDLATSVPVPTNGSKTYLFHIRKGIKFSNGQTLKPSD